MTKAEQREHFNKFADKMQNVLLSKGDDYANIDRLSNFKLAGAICGLTAEQNCLSLMATKVARLGVLLSDTDNAPKNESIEDSILDLANYAVLLSMIMADKRNAEIESIRREIGGGEAFTNDAQHIFVFQKPDPNNPLQGRVALGGDERDYKGDLGK